MRCFKGLFILVLLGAFVCMDLSAQCGKKVLVRRNGCPMAAAMRNARAKRKNRRKPRKVNLLTRQENRFEEDTGNTFRAPCDVERASFDREKNIGSLQKLHALQLQFIRERKTLSEEQKNALLYDLDREAENLTAVLKEIRNFPYKRTFTSLENALTGLCRKDKISEEKMLRHIQKLQMRSMKKYYSRIRY